MRRTPAGCASRMRRRAAGRRALGVRYQPGSGRDRPRQAVAAVVERIRPSAIQILMRSLPPILGGTSLRSRDFSEITDRRISHVGLTLHSAKNIRRTLLCNNPHPGCRSSAAHDRDVVDSLDTVEKTNRPQSRGFTYDELQFTTSIPLTFQPRRVSDSLGVRQKQRLTK